MHWAVKAVQRWIRPASTVALPQVDRVNAPHAKADPGKPRAAHAARKDGEKGRHTDDDGTLEGGVPFIPSDHPLRGIIWERWVWTLRTLALLPESLQSGHKMMSQI